MDQADFTPENRRVLDGFLARRHPAGAVAVLDLDGTCVHHDTGEAVLFAMAREGSLEVERLLDGPEIWRPFEAHPGIESPRALLREAERDPALRQAAAKAVVRAYGELVCHAGKEVAYPWAAFLLAGKTPEQARALSLQVLAREIERPLGTEPLAAGPTDPDPLVLPTGLRPYRAMGELVTALERAGVAPWIVTASNQFTAEVYAERFLGIPARRVIGITPQVESGRIQAGLDPAVPLTFGAGKVRAIQAIIGRRPLLAAGDTLSQCDMLDSATELRLLILRQSTPELLRRIGRLRESAPVLVQPRFIDPPGETDGITACPA